MSLDYDVLFGRLGRLAGLLNELNGHRGATVPASVALIEDAYEADPDLVDGLFAALSSYQGSAGGLLGYLARLAQQTVVNEVNEANPLPDLGLATALAELVRQMEADSQSIAEVSAAATVTADSNNIGDPAWVVATTDERGRALPYAFAEDLVATVTADGQLGGGASSGSEIVRVRGERAEGSALSQDWPRGSGASLSLTVIDPSLDARGGFGQLLTNGDFADWDEGSSSATGAPSSWTVEVGTVGTDVTHESSSGYGQEDALVIDGDGSTLTAIQQEIDTLEPLRQYAVCFRAKIVGSPAAGVLRVALVDGDGTVTNDDAGSANSFTVDLTGLGSSFAAKSGTFRTPGVLPSGLALEFALTTALSSGSSLVIDAVGFARTRPAYPGGPSLAVFAGAIDAVKADRWTIAVTTTATDATFARALDRLLGLRNLGVVLPSAASPTIDDGLIDGSSS